MSAYVQKSGAQKRKKQKLKEYVKDNHEIGQQLKGLLWEPGRYMKHELEKNELKLSYLNLCLTILIFNVFSK